MCGHRSEERGEVVDWWWPVGTGGVKWEAVEPRGPWRGAVSRGFGWIGRGPGWPSLDNGRDGICRLRAFPSRSESRLISIGVFFG